LNSPWRIAQGQFKNVPNGLANTRKTVETVKKLRDPDATPLKRGVNEIEPSFSSAPWRIAGLSVFWIYAPDFAVTLGAVCD